MKTQIDTVSLAKQIIKEFPSFAVIAKNPKYLISKFVNPMQHFAFLNSNQWELLAFACQNILTHSIGRPFYNSYYYHDNEGYAWVYDAADEEYKVDIEVFKALCLIVYFSWAELPINKIKYELIYKLKEDYTCYRILD